MCESDLVFRHVASFEDFVCPLIRNAFRSAYLSSLLHYHHRVLFEFTLGSLVCSLQLVLDNLLVGLLPCFVVSSDHEVGVDVGSVGRDRLGLLPSQLEVLESGSFGAVFSHLEILCEFRSDDLGAAHVVKVEMANLGCEFLCFRVLRVGQLQAEGDQCWVESGGLLCFHQLEVVSC